MPVFVDDLVCLVTHKPGKGAAERISRRSDENRGPEKFWIQLDQSENDWLRTQRQEGGRNEGNYENRGQAELWQRQQRD